MSRWMRESVLYEMSVIIPVIIRIAELPLANTRFTLVECVAEGRGDRDAGDRLDREGEQPCPLHIQMLACLVSIARLERTL